VTPVEIIDIGREAVMTLIQVAGPIMMVGLGVGLLVSVFQSISQLQEMTLTFVPKILAIFASLIVFLPFMINTLVAFMNQIAQRIIGVT
jgi:flagellar biosynthetic protein FliQ